MWLFTQHGFYSVVAHNTKPDVMLVRARTRRHLTALKKRFPKLLGSKRIYKLKKADYPYRMFVPKKTWTRVVSLLANEVDYPNFKKRAGNVEWYSFDDKWVLHEVWNCLRRLENPQDRW